MKISRMIQHRPHDTKGTMKKLVKELKPFWLMITAVALLSIFANVLSLLGPYFCGEAINEASRGKGMVDFNALWKWALLMLFSYVLSSLVSLGINMIMVVVSKKRVLHVFLWESGIDLKRMRAKKNSLSLNP